MSEENRRQFLQRLLLGGASAAAIPSFGAQPAGAEVARVDRRVLGRTGAEVSILGLGLGTAFTVNTRSKDADTVKALADQRESAEKLLHQALGFGINYWDTARMYGESEELAGLVAKKRRAEIFLASKSANRTYDGFKRDLEVSLKRLQTDYLDLYQIHWINAKRDIDLQAVADGAVKAALEARDQKVIRAIGLTGHDSVDLLIEAVKMFDPDVLLGVFPCTRPEGGKFEDQLLPLAIQKKMGVVAMKTVKQGVQADLKGTDLIRYALGLKGVHCAIVGLDSAEHLVQNAAMATKFTPLTPGTAESMRERASRTLAGTTPPWELPGYRDGGIV